MTSKPRVSRSEIIEELTRSLSEASFAQAFWEGGAAAWSRVDEWSDIDAYLLVDEGRVDEAFERVEQILSRLSPIKQKYVVRKNPWPGVSQAFYMLENASEFLVLDLAILTSSSQERFLEPEIHGRSSFYFNKTRIDEAPPTDINAFRARMKQGMRGVQERFEMFSNFVEKEIRRGNSLEGLEYYRTIVIPSLVQELRAKYSPMHYDFRMRYIHHELPPDIVKRLEDLCFITGVTDLKAKYPIAVKWYNELASNPKHIPSSAS